MNGFDLNSLILEIVSDHELLTAKDRTSCSVRGWTALKFGQWIMNLSRLHDLVKSILISELTVRIVYTVLVIFPGDLSEVLCLGTILFHVFSSCISKEFWSKWTFAFASHLNIFLEEICKRILTVIEKGFKTSCKHLFKAKCHYTL